MIRSRPFGNAAGSAARSSSSFYRRTTQTVRQVVPAVTASFVLKELQLFDISWRGGFIARVAARVAFEH
jgi:hypothetical protein